MKVVPDIFIEIRQMRTLMYRPPLGKKAQRVIQRASKPGKVKIFTKDEIKQYQRS